MNNIRTIMKNCRKRSWVVIIICAALGLMMGMMQQFLGKNFNGDLSQMEVVIIQQEDNIFNQSLADYLTNQLNMNVRIDNDYDQYTEPLLDRDLSAIIELKKDFYTTSVKDRKAGKVEITTIDNYANEAYLKSYLNVFLESVDLIFQSADGDIRMADQMLNQLELPEVTVVGADDAVQERSANYGGFTLTMGFYLNFVWVIGIFLGLVVMGDRLDGTFTRIQGTPAKGFHYMLGTVIYYVLVSSVSPIMFIGTLVLRGLEVGLNYGLVFLIMVCMNIFVIGIASIFALLINSKIGVVIGVYVFGAIIAILGGAYFDLSGIKGSLEKIYRLVPTYWYMDCIRSSQETKGFDPTLNIVILILFSLLSLLIAGVLFNRQMETRE